MNYITSVRLFILNKCPKPLYSRNETTKFLTQRQGYVLNKQEQKYRQTSFKTNNRYDPEIYIVKFNI